MTTAVAALATPGRLWCSAVGSPETVRRWLAQFAAETGADELILAGQIYDHAARRRSFEIAAAVRGSPVPVARGV